MITQRKFAGLLLVSGVMLLFILSAIDARFRVDRSLWRVNHREQVKKGAYEIEPEEMESWEDEEREPRADYPDELAKLRRLQLQDEKGFIPADGMEKARQQVKRMRVAVKTEPKDAAGVKPDSWSWLGPGNIGGRIRSIIIDPANANNMWVGSVSGGIWRTINGGAGWFPVNDFLANLSVSTMVINPTNANIMYAGTGETFTGPVTGENGFQGAGIFKSTDRGVTWNQLASTTTGDWFFVSRLAISPNGNTILAATDSGIWRSTDAGITWIQRTFNERTFDIDFNPIDSTRAIAGGANASLGIAEFSTDGGFIWNNATFNPAISIRARIELAYAPSNPNRVYASVNQNGGEVYRSTDGGQTYTRVNTGNGLLGEQGGYGNIIWVNPQDANFVIVAGVLPYRSTDGGITFTLIGDATISLPHADHHMIVAHPGFNNTTNRTAFFSNDGGIFRFNDVATPAPATIGWTELNNNLGITQFYGAAGNAATGVIIGGTQDNGTVRYTGNTEGWNTTFGGDGGFCAADPSNSNYFYGEYVDLAIYRSIDGGVSASYIFNGLGDANVHRANFIAPFILDPNEPNTMLAGGWGLWRSTDIKSIILLPTWARIKAPTADNSPISAIVVSPFTSTLICVGHNNGDIYRTFNGTDAAPIWTKIDTAGLPNRYVTRLTIDPNHSTNWIYATFGGFSADNVYRTTDYGATWTDITGSGATGLPDVPVRSLVYHPRNPNLLYVGTEIGVFTSDDAGATWEVPQDGPANVAVYELFWLGSDLIAATYGRGLYRASGGIYVDCNYNGIQLGTFDQPYKTVTTAVNVVSSYRPIWIKPCHYNEPMTITKRLELRSLGGSAVIGKP